MIVDRTDYLKRMQEMVDDTNKFEKLNVKPGKDYNFMTKEKKDVDNLLSELVDKRSLSESDRDKLSPDGPNPARLYDFPKSTQTTCFWSPKV